MTSSSNQSQQASDSQVIDFDIHGVVGLRLLNPSAKDLVAFTERLGLYQAPLQRDVDIIVRFTDNLSPPMLQYLGLNSAGFTNEDEGFYIFNEKTGAIEARVPLEQVGKQCEIVCRRGIGWAPLLSDIINFTFLKKGYIPLHAAAFRYKGCGILVMGWVKGGKTEALFSFANHGAEYVGDEWVLLSSDGRKMFGLPVPIALWDWQFKHIPNLLPKVSLQQKIVFKSVHFLDAFYRNWGTGRLGRMLPLKILERALPTLRRQLKIMLLPQTIFGDSVCSQGVDVDQIFLMMSHSSSDITVEACAPLEIAERMIHSNEYEQWRFIEHYKEFRFAFPQLRNEFLDGVNERQHTLLRRALEGKETYKVVHPFPVSFEELFAHMEPFCRKITRQAVPVVDENDRLSRQEQL